MKINCAKLRVWVVFNPNVREIAETNTCSVLDYLEETNRISETIYNIFKSKSLAI